MSQDKPLRVAIYARLSVDRTGEAESPERQVASCRRYLEAHGWEVAGQPFIDRDVSGWDAKKKRPRFEEMLTFLEAGNADGVIVWKLDRFGRRMVTAIKNVERITDAGAVLMSVSDNVDTSSQLGQGILALLFSVAGSESESIGKRVSLAWQEAATNGRPHVGGVRCWGFDKDCNQIPAEAKEARRIVDRVLAGDGLGQVVRDLNRRGIRSVGSKKNGPGQWTLPTLRRWLVAPTLAGLRSHKGDIIPGTWKGIITPAERDQLQIILGERQGGGVKTPPAYLLSGIARCGQCGEPMRVKRPGNGRPFYACRRDRTNGAKACGANFASVAGVDAYVGAQLVDYLARGNVEPISADQDPGKLQATIADYETALQELNEARFITKEIDEKGWRDTRDVLVERMESLRSSLVVLEAGERLPSGDQAELLSWWETGSTLAQRRQAIKDAARVVIHKPAGPKKHAPVFDVSRVELRWNTFSGTGQRIAQAAQPQPLEVFGTPEEADEALN